MEQQGQGIWSGPVRAIAAVTLAFTAAALPSVGLPGGSALGGAGPAALVACLLLGTTLATLSIIDWRTMRLPDALTLPLAAAGVILHWPLGGEAALASAAGGAAGFAILAGIGLIYRRLRGRDGLGLGDAKLLAAAGTWLGIGAVASVIALAAFAALAAAALAAVLGRAVSADDRIPFGPFLAFAFWIVWLYGPIGLDAAGAGR